MILNALQKPTTKLPSRRNRRGFALIASLTLMMLLGMVAIGILAVINSQSRISMHSLHQAEARQQALIGLDAAIADLQIELGPDQRVSATSGILSEDQNMPQHILGVWNSWQAPLYGQTDGKDIRSTYTEGRSSMFRRWLISTSDQQTMRKLDAVRSLSTRSPGKRVLLVGQGTLGRNADNRQYIYADLVEMPASGKNVGCYAWWIGGENQKANIAITPRKATDDPIEILHRTWDTPAPSFKASKELSFLPNEIANADKIVTLNTLPLSSHVSINAGGSYFHDVTTFSYTLPINVRNGGLKHDLNLLLNKPSLSGTDFAGTTSRDCPLAEEQDLPTGTEANMPIGSWQVMHAYYNTYPNGSQTTKESFASRLQGSLTNAYSLMSGNIVSASTDKGDSVSFYDTRTIENDESAGYARTPVLMSLLGSWGISVSQTKYRKGNTLHYAYSPMVMWWNPYNVEMRVHAKKLWAYTLPYRTTCVQVWDDRALLKDPNRPWSPKLMLNPSTSDGTQIPWQCCFRIDWGNYFVNSLEDQSSDIIFEPGEIIAFTMAGDILSLNEVDAFGTPQEAPFIIGDHPDKMTHFRADYHEYVNLTNPDARDMYDYHIDRFSARLALENKKAPFYTGGIAYGIATSLINGNNLITMGELHMSAAQYTASAHTHTAGREAFAITYGYDGINCSAADSNSLIKMGQVDRFNGANAISPGSFLLGWYDYDDINDGEMTFLDTKWNVNMFGNDPVYYVAIGVVPKSYNSSFNDAFPKFRGKDFRGKIWQHSSPAFWASALYKPDDQQRQYHPYQLAAIDMGSSINRGILDTVNEKNGVYGITSVGSGGGEAVSFISVLELPLHPPFSLAGFSGMRLTPGWYHTQGSGNQAAFARARRIQYQAGVPGVGIGNSFADPCLPAGDVYTYHESRISSNFSTNARIFSDFFDHGLIINDSLWDRWFCSSMSDMPTKNGMRNVREVVEDFVYGREELPVSRYKRVTSPTSEAQIIARIMADDGWRHVARYLLIEGGFNVNSVSEEAWTAVLLGLAKRDLVSNASGDLHKVQKDSDDEVLFSRFMVSTADRSIDSEGGYNVVEGSASARPNMKLATAWSEVRALSPESIRELARQMVKKVRERGPFLNMSDFINRRLDGGTDAALTGALQAAIDATDINAPFKDSSYNVQPLSGTFYQFPKAEEGSMYTAAPGYLIQSDVLASLGNILTVRDDTFVVRAYGCVRNSSGAILSQAWCEAVVQRTMEYVDPTNKPEDAPKTTQTLRGMTNNNGLSEINRVMGRRFRVVSFRWLDHWNV